MPCWAPSPRCFFLHVIPLLEHVSCQVYDKPCCGLRSGTCHSSRPKCYRLHPPVVIPPFRLSRLHLICKAVISARPIITSITQTNARDVRSVCVRVCLAVCSTKRSKPKHSRPSHCPSWSSPLHHQRCADACLITITPPHPLPLHQHQHPHRIPGVCYCSLASQFAQPFSPASWFLRYLLSSPARIPDGLGDR